MTDLAAQLEAMTIERDKEKAERERLWNDLVLARASTDGAMSQLLEVQQDCINAVQERDRLRAELAALKQPRKEPEAVEPNLLPSEVSVGSLRIGIESHFGMWRLYVQGSREKLIFALPNDDENCAKARATVLVAIIRDEIERSR